MRELEPFWTNAQRCRSAIGQRQPSDQGQTTTKEQQQREREDCRPNRPKRGAAQLARELRAVAPTGKQRSQYRVNRVLGQVQAGPVRDLGLAAAQRSGGHERFGVSEVWRAEAWGPRDSSDGLPDHARALAERVIQKLERAAWCVGRQPDQVCRLRLQLVG